MSGVVKQIGGYLLEDVRWAWFLEEGFPLLTGLEILALRTSLDSICYVSCHAWPVHRLSGTLFRPNLSLVRAVQVPEHVHTFRFRDHDPRSVQDQTVVTRQLVTQFPEVTESEWELVG